MKKAIYIQTGACHVPARFWDILITDNEETIKRYNDRNIMIRELTEEGQEKLENDTTYCRGDIWKYLLQQQLEVEK